jgi:antitoxin HicB
LTQQLRHILITMKQYTVSGGKVVLTLQEAEEGGYVVTSPLDPQLITEADTVKEAFENARDALAALAASRRKLIKKLAGVKA